MGTFLLLVAEASAARGEMAAAAEGGFGLDLNILETNLINLVIIVGVLVYFGRGVVGKTLSDRREKIETAIVGAERRQKEAVAALAEEQRKLTQAQEEAQRIRATAEENAKTAREAILAETARDIENMKKTVSVDLDAERARAIAQLRQQVVAMALQKVESQLRTGVDNAAQQQLIDRSIALLGGHS